MKCIDNLGKKEFTLDEIYSFENVLAQKYVNNKHIKDKIRQQLQFLRDKGYLEFINRGIYRLK
jgi:type II restriction enzyme